MEYDLSRFTQAHERDYQQAYSEICEGSKRTHWMWYIFPQLAGLGKSATSQYYAIRDLNEAAVFWHDPYLGGHLREISRALLQLETDDPTEVFSFIDAKKLQSCMTLFSLVSPDDTVFSEVLDKFFGGRPDHKTLHLLGIS